MKGGGSEGVRTHPVEVVKDGQEMRSSSLLLLSPFGSEIAQQLTVRKKALIIGDVWAWPVVGVVTHSLLTRLYSALSMILSCSAASRGCHSNSCSNG